MDYFARLVELARLGAGVLLGLLCLASDTQAQTFANSSFEELAPGQFVNGGDDKMIFTAAPGWTITDGSPDWMYGPGVSLWDTNWGEYFQIGGAFDPATGLGGTLPIGGTFSFREGLGQTVSGFVRAAFIESISVIRTAFTRLRWWCHPPEVGSYFSMASPSNWPPVRMSLEASSHCRIRPIGKLVRTCFRLRAQRTRLIFWLTTPREQLRGPQDNGWITLTSRKFPSPRPR